MKEQKVTINLLSSHHLQEQMKPEEIETIYHGKPTDADILTVVTKKGIKHFCDEVEFVTHGDQPVQDGTEPFDTEGLRWHPMSDEMLGTPVCWCMRSRTASCAATTTDECLRLPTTLRSRRATRFT